MDQLRIQISGEDPVSPARDQSWIKLTLDPPEKTSEITNQQLADWLDAAYGIQDHCTGSVAEDAYNPADPGDSTQQRLQAALSGQSCYNAADLLGLSDRCSLNRRAGIAKKFTVYVHCSSEEIRDRYKFTCSSDISPSGPTAIQKIIQAIIDFTDAGEVPVYRYADSGDVAELWARKGYAPQWLGDVLIGTRRVNPSSVGIGWSNGRVVLSEPVSGRLIIFLPIQCDAWAVSVPGAVIDGKRDYTATAYAFDESLDSPAEVELSDEQDSSEEGSNCELCGSIDDAILTDGTGGGDTDINTPPGTCRKRIDWELRNRCSGDLVDSGTRYEYCDCPDQRVLDVSYTDRGGKAEDKYTAEEFEDSCCYPPPLPDCLPCKRIISNYPGGAPILPSEQYWRDRYAPAQVVFNRLRPEGGCGERIDSFVTEDCCKSVPAIEYLDQYSPDVIAEGWSATVYFSGGLLPFQVEIEGTGFYLDPAGTVISSEINSRAVTIYARDSCGLCTITATDSCNNSDSGQIRSSNFVWVTIQDTTQDDTAWGGPCIIGQRRYWDDWCNSGPPSTCTGSGQQYCSRPGDLPPETDAIEGNIIQEPQCP